MTDIERYFAEAQLKIGEMFEREAARSQAMADSHPRASDLAEIGLDRAEDLRLVACDKVAEARMVLAKLRDQQMGRAGSGRAASTDDRYDADGR